MSGSVWSFWGVLLVGEDVLFAGSPGVSGEFDVSAVFEEAVEEGFCEVVVVEDVAPLAEWFVGGEDGWFLSEVSGVDDGVEDVGGVACVGEVSDFVDDEDFCCDVGFCGVLKFAGFGGGGEFVDDGCGSGEFGVSAVLYGVDGDCDGEVGFAASRFAAEDEVSSVFSKVRCKIGCNEVASEGTFGGEGEVFDGFYIGKSCRPCHSLGAGLFAVDDFCNDEVGKKFSVAPAFVDGLLFGFFENSSDSC